MRKLVDIVKQVFDYDKRQVRKVLHVVEQVNGLERQVRELSDQDLANTADYFREKLGIDLKKNRRNYDLELEGKDSESYKKEVEEERQRLLEVLPEVYARVREAARRVANHRHFDVQLIGGIFLAHNKIIEVYTGEGKTNIALLPAALYGITGRGVHIHTVNNYLAKRDAEWAGHIMHALGLSVAVITSEGAYKFVPDDQALKLKGDEIKPLLEQKDLTNMSTLRGANLVPVPKFEAYMADIVYGEANEFGFDYLRDNMATDIYQRVQRSRYYAIVDEADSILIDEARVPLIISQSDQDSTELYIKFAQVASRLEPEEDYVVDEKTKGVTLTEQGVHKVERMLGVKDIWSNTLYIKHLHTALKAKALFKRDRDYIVRDGKVLIVDEFTGRVQPNRRYSEGLHQAIEAKEGVPVRAESKTLATISHQNFYRMYTYLAGMTGTAATEREEFRQIYGLDVVVVPTYKPIIRKDHPDVVFKTKRGKFKAILKQVKELYERGQPVLVGTASIEDSEELSRLFKKAGIPHEVLNAKYHEKEAMIIAKAGRKGAVTIATNMAGRGTDIKIDDEVRKLGGLVVLGAQRHEARRIDNQLRGRTGRLGDPGWTRFYLSLEDDLLRIFGGDYMRRVFDGMRVDEDMPIASQWISKMVEKAQRKVESLNFDIRRRLVEFDDVVNTQREIVYELRRRVLVLLSREQEDYKKFSAKAKLESAHNLSGGALDQYGLMAQEFSLLDPYNFYVSYDNLLVQVASPLRLWVLKQLILRLQDFAPMGKDIAIPIEQYRYFQEYIDAVVPDKIWEQMLEFAGYTQSTLKEDIKRHTQEDQVRFNSYPIYKVFIGGFALHLSKFNPQQLNEYLRVVLLQTLDYLWIEHIDTLDDLRSGIFLRGYAQRDPLVEFKQEAAVLFDRFFFNLRDFMTQKLFHVVAKSENIV